MAGIIENSGSGAEGAALGVAGYWQLSSRREEMLCRCIVEGFMLHRLHCDVGRLRKEVRFLEVRFLEVRFVGNFLEY